MVEAANAPGDLPDFSSASIQLLLKNNNTISSKLLSKLAYERITISFASDQFIFLLGESG